MAIFTMPRTPLGPGRSTHFREVRKYVIFSLPGSLFFDYLLTTGLRDLTNRAGDPLLDSDPCDKSAQWSDYEAEFESQTYRVDVLV